MADVVLTKDETGRLCGLTDADERRWSRFRTAIQSMPQGGTIKASFKLPRSPGFHARHFKILSELFKSQDQFEDFEAFRAWVQVGAGFCDLLPGPGGKPVAIPKSIAWDALEDADFAEHHRACIEFIRSTRFSRFLWPQMTDLNADNMVNGILSEFGS